MRSPRPPPLKDRARRCTQGVGDTPAQLVDTGAHLLQAGPRGSDQPDGAAPDLVGKAQPHAIDYGSAAVGPHDQQTPFCGHLFQRDLFFKGDVVAIEKDVPAQAQCLPGNAGGIASRHGDQYPMGVRQHLGCGFQALGQVVLLDAATPPGQ